MQAFDEAIHQDNLNSKSSGLSGLWVLVVDDDEDTRTLFSHILQAQGVEVALAASAQEAFDVMRMVIPDVLISDINLPDESGYEFIRKVRRLQPSQGGLIPAIAVTGDIQDNKRVEALDAGYQRHLAKPFDIHELVGIVAELVQKRVA